MTLRSDLVFLPLDDEAIVFSQEAQSLIGLNASAALVLRQLQEGRSPSEIAQALASEGLVAPKEAGHWVTATFDALAASGLLAKDGVFAVAGRGMQDQTQTLQASRAAEMPPNAPFEPAAERRYRLLDLCVSIRFAMPEQVPRVDSAIGHLATEGHSPNVVIDIHGVTLDNGAIRSHVYYDGEPVDYATGLHRLGPIVKAALWHAAIDAYDFRFYIHAGVVGTGQSCILLPAAAGSGKSSLTAALTRRGLRYFSDEVALIEPRTFRAQPVPLALCVKNTGWELIARYYPEIAGLPIHQRMDGKVVRYLAPPSGAIARTSAPVSHVIFPQHQADGPTELQPIGRPEALRRLMEQCLALRQRLDRDNVADLVSWIAGLKCYALTFRSLDRAAELVEEVIE